MMKLLLMMLLLYSHSCFAQWPELPFPKTAKVEAIGENVRLNGVPMRMYRIRSQDDAKTMLSFYRDALGPRHAETRVRKRKEGGDFLNTQILSQLMDGYLITVRVTQVGQDETETLLAISDGRASRSTKGMPLGFSLPADSQLLSDMESMDAGKNSRQLVFTNKHEIEVNRDFLVDVLANKGYRLQPELTFNNENNIKMLFVGNNREAMVVLNRLKGKTSVVMTTISNLEITN